VLLSLVDVPLPLVPVDVPLLPVLVDEPLLTVEVLLALVDVPLDPPELPLVPCDEEEVPPSPAPTSEKAFPPQAVNVDRDSPRTRSEDVSVRIAASRARRVPHAKVEGSRTKQGPFSVSLVRRWVTLCRAGSGSSRGSVACRVRE
jgi:hypothetical protein